MGKEVPSTCHGRYGVLAGPMAHPLPDVPLPTKWPELTKIAVVHALCLARFVLMYVRGWCADSRLARVRLAGERDAAVAAKQQLAEELRIVRARVESIPPARRPRYASKERMAILALRAAAGWTAVETARRFQLSVVTVRAWMARLEAGEADGLLELRHPAHRFPDFVTGIVQALKTTFPALGKRKLAEILARAGLVLSASTVRRMQDRPRVELPEQPDPGPEPSAPAADGSAADTTSSIDVAPRAEEMAIANNTPRPRIVSKAPHHLWHLDFTILPLLSGWWVSWLCQAIGQRWPACFWLGVVLDHYSRSVVAWKLWRKEPSAADTCALLDDAVAKAGRGPKHIVTDQGSQFQDEYRAWCARVGAKPRWGAVHRHGSIAVIERFFLSLKTELLAKLGFPRVSTRGMRAEIDAYMVWYGEHRPHRTLGGRTPNEVCRGDEAAVVQIEPRARVSYGDDGEVVLHPACGPPVVDLSGFRDRAHLPIVTLRKAA